MLKIDKPIVEEFLGKNVDITIDECSRLKTFRAYGMGTPVNKMIYVVTPLMADEEFFKGLDMIASAGGKTYKTHKRGRNTVVTFEDCQ